MAIDALAGFSRQMKKMPAFLRESLTYDRGSEMAWQRPDMGALHLEVESKLLHTALVDRLSSE